MRSMGRGARGQKTLQGAEKVHEKTAGVAAIDRRAGCGDATDVGAASARSDGGDAGDAGSAPSPDDGAAQTRAAAAPGAGSSVAGGPLGWLRAWWRGLPLMRAFACYTIVCIVAAGAVSVLGIEVLMTVYDRLDAARNAERPEVDGGPYVYDAETDELVPAVSIDLANGFGDRILFLGLRGGTGRATAESGAEVVRADNGRPVVYATLDMVADDPALSIRDWGANYVEADYAEAGGNPYDPVPIAVGDLAAYDARERVERAQVTDGVGGTLGELNASVEGALVSNVGYYVASSAQASESPLMLGLRLAAGFLPFVAIGACAVAAFRRFYRRRLAEPLAVLRGAADRIAVQDLDFAVGEVRGREFGRLAEAFEHMRGSLEQAQRELWETSEARRRLNAAFAHDLRTPVTVLKGTLEMARAADGPSVDRAAASTPGEESGDAGAADGTPGGAADGTPSGAVGAHVVSDRMLDTLTAQVSRLEAYAHAMTGVTKLEDRPVHPEPIGFRALCGELEASARPVVERAGLRFTMARSSDDRVLREPLLVDVSLVDEVLGNLVGNASRYAEGEVLLEVRAAVAGERAVLEVAVADDGPGFSAEALRHGADAFFGEAKSAEHFGLGLAIATTLARLHGGSLSLENAAAGGARITATFDAGALRGGDSGGRLLSEPAGAALRGRSGIRGGAGGVASRGRSATRIARAATVARDDGA